MSTKRRAILPWIAGLTVLLVLVVVAALPAATVVRDAAPRAAHEDETLDGLMRRKAFLAGQFETTRDPLLSLSVDPVEKTATILLSGVPLRTVRASGASVSYALRNVDPDSVVIARLVERTGMIPPEPIRRVEAPADTAEANQAPTEVPVETTPAAVNLHLDNGIVIRFTPNDRSGADAFAIVRYRLFERMRNNVIAAWDGLRMAPPRIRGEVELDVGDADAKALFRALSDGSPVVLRTVGR